jgi:energy-coupling factor transporter transmembrane protein EcfT
MSLPAAQDPARAFDYAELTQFHNPAYDSLYGVILSGGWFLALAAGIMIVVVRRVDKSKLPAVWARQSFWAAGLLLVLPVLGSGALELTSGAGDSVPNFAGLAKGASTSNKNAEFISWANDRYRIELTGIQAAELQKLTNKGFMVTSNETNPVIFNGSLIHGTSAAGQIILVDKEDKEMAVRK